MVIVIECESCHSRYRLAKSLFKESKAIRVRCRKCGGYIVVQNPDQPDVVEEVRKPFPRVVPPPPPKPEIAPKPEPQPPWEPEEPRERERKPEEPPREQAPEPETPPQAQEQAAPPEEPTAPPEEPTAPREDAAGPREEPPRAEELPPEAPPVEAPPVEEPPAEKPFPMEETTKAMAELLNELDATEPPPPDAGKKPDPGYRGPVKVTPYPDSPDGSEALASVLEDLFKNQPAAKHEPAAPAAAEPSKPVEPRKPARPQELPRIPASRPPYASPLFIFVVILWLLLLAGAALFFGTDYFDRWFRIGKAQPAAAAPAKRAPAKHPYEIRDLHWFTETAFEGGKFFAVTGTVRNLGKPLSRGFLVRATIMGRDNTVLSEKTVFAGNQIDNTTLRAMREENVDVFLSGQGAPDSPNLEIPTGGAVPFMAVFFNPQEQVHTVLVKATPGQEL